MQTSFDSEFQRRLERKMDEEFNDRVEKMAFHDPREKLDERRGELRMLRYIGQLCKDIATEIGGS